MMEPTMSIFMIIVETVLMGTGSMASVAAFGKGSYIFHNRVVDVTEREPIDFWTAQYLIPLGVLALMILLCFIICICQCFGSRGSSPDNIQSW